MIPKFENLPYLLRQCAVSLLGFRNYRRRFGPEFTSWSRFLRESQEWLPPQIERWQREKLVTLVANARDGCSYYQTVLPPLESLPTSAGLRDVLDSLPILEKPVLKARTGEFRNVDVKQVTTSSTSGSTGSPMTVGHDALSIERRFAFLMDQYRMLGVGIRDPKVRLSGRIICPVGRRVDKPYLFNMAENQLFLSTYHLDEAHSEVIAEKLKRFQPMLLDGYPSGILNLLRCLAGRGVRIPALRGIITTAETLHPELREELVALAGVPVLDYYSASEGLPFIQQCPQGTYHVRWQSGIVEVDRVGRYDFEGDGELVCTSFVQDCYPLIRYRTGDLVSGLRAAVDQHCSCGLKTPVVEKVQGRVEDLVYTPDGRSLGMFTYRTLKYIEGLGETQVIQHNYADFEVNTVLASSVDESVIANQIQENFERALGYSIALRVNKVAQLPKGANGKVRLVMSKVGNTRAIRS